jgi:hypothetical protein
MPSQVRRLGKFSWKTEPFVVSGAVPALTLFAAADWVVCGGGTMLREAAYLGIPAVSIFGGPVGSVDAHLESLGAVRLVRNAADLTAIDWLAPPPVGRVERNPDLVDQLTGEIERRAANGV